MTPIQASILAALTSFQEQQADAAPPPGNFFMDSLPLFLIIGVIFWFVVLGPERKQRKKREAMIAALEKGDKVMTNAGIYGTVVQAQGDVITLQVDDKVRLRFARSAVQGLVDPGEKKKGEEADAKAVVTAGADDSGS